MKKSVFLKNVKNPVIGNVSETRGKSFVELPDAIQFLQIPSERVFQQPQDFATPIRNGTSGPFGEGRFLQPYVNVGP